MPNSVPVMDHMRGGLSFKTRMVKRTNNANGASLLILNKKTATASAASLALAIVVCVGILWLSCLVFVVVLVPSAPPVGGRSSSSSSSSSIETLANSVLTRLDRLYHSVPISSSSSSSSHRPAGNEPSDEQRPSRRGAGVGGGIDVLDDEDDAHPSSPEAIFLAASMKECLPGRDDASGQINPTTRKKRECLRHVPDARNGGGMADADVGVDGTAPRRMRPRIGIMIPPGLIGRSFGDWIAGALRIDDDGGKGGISSDDIEIVITSQVPVYGYGKSHGYTKLVRLVTLPLPLAAYDAYYSIAMSSSSLMGPGHDASSVSGGGVHIDGGSSSSSSSLRSRSDSNGAMRYLPSSFSTPTAATIGTIVRLVMRFHCRLSHVSAHTAMVTLTLEDVLKDPAGALDRVLSFVWKDDWDWKRRETLPEKQEEKKWGALDDRLLVDRDELLRTLLDRASLVVDAASSLYANSGGGGVVDAYRKSIRDAFSYEMERSSDMSAWPCPSFWEGVDGGIISGGHPGSVEGRNNDNGDGDDQTLILRRISGEMVPNCSDDEPFARCTVNKDRCEVRGDAKCN